MELGSPIFATHDEVNTILNLEYVEPTVGSYKYGSKKIPYSYKSVKDCMELWLGKSAKEKNYIPFHQIDVCINLDHGKGHSRISANFIGRTKDKDER